MTDERSGSDFGAALSWLKSGRKVARTGWDGKGMWLCLMHPFVIPEGMVNARTKPFVPPLIDIRCGAYIVLWTANGVWQPGWAPSQTDMLTDDWVIVD